MLASATIFSLFSIIDSFRYFNEWQEYDQQGFQQALQVCVPSSRFSGYMS